MSPDFDAPTSAPPAALLTKNPLRWLSFFGPGAVIASLTIGSGELIFSSRGGAIFGYRLLFVFLLVLLLKWALVFGTARHIVLTGAHPFERWAHLPGPRGWLPFTFLLLAALAFPIWVSFHAGTIGTLLAGLTGTSDAWHGGAHFVWGLGTLAMVIALVASGGYARLERIQLVIIIAMLAGVVISLLLLKPDWLALLKGCFMPQSLHYPEWIQKNPEFAARPEWLEVTTYVGVIGGGGYDYLAYTAYLRGKHWGRANATGTGPAELAAIAANPTHPARQWLRAPLIDCTLSFAAVLIFAGVFVVCGTLILAPSHQLPGGNNLLNLQSQFVSASLPGLKFLYFLGAFLTMFGTLYGTVEVAPPILREIVRGWNASLARQLEPRLRPWAVWWVQLAGAAVLGGSLAYHLTRGRDNPPGLIALLTPANLFTGVTACGLICLLSVWSDRRFLPAALRMNGILTALNILAGICFVVLGLKGYWDHSGWRSLLLLAATGAVGLIAAWVAAGASQRQKHWPPILNR
ncbi:MAG TPA: Nramp family divalent metal transporter [Verrucomicrobiota bacterium]|nr:Nramp family divalent metal transporter [Verrucomicrobiota bacterium]